MEVQLVVVDAKMMKDKSFQQKNVTMSFPFLETEEFCLFDTLAIVKFFAKQSGDASLTGSSALENALIEMWLQRAVTQLNPDLVRVTDAIFGEKMFEDEYKSAHSAVKQMLMNVNKHLSDRKWLVGD